MNLAQKKIWDVVAAHPGHSEHRLRDLMEMPRTSAALGSVRTVLSMLAKDGHVSRSEDGTYTINGWWVAKQSPVTGCEAVYGPFPTREEAFAAWEAHQGPQHGLWYVSEYEPEAPEDFGPADGNWSAWLAQNNID